MRITVRESISTRDANALHNHKNFKSHQKHSNQIYGQLLSGKIVRVKCG
ncbi:hypothetical protein MNBD_ALPHA11-1230 [hydrothermal vent metagenome]|uniref:Uncharacterized protein n=1 Tax=hydrothermal vent metagenome TaxID=652676 RepID=A0A3B0TC56_9ZZZZ